MELFLCTKNFWENCCSSTSSDQMGMGGVDVCDRLLSAYRPRFRSKKCWWNLFWHIVNLAVVASFKFFTHAYPATKMTHLQFRRYVARSLVRHEHDRRHLGGPSSAPVPASRYDGINHHLKPCTQGRCVICQKNTRLMCVKCEQRVHEACVPHYEIYLVEFVPPNKSICATPDQSICSLYSFEHISFYQEYFLFHKMNLYFCVYILCNQWL